MRPLELRIKGVTRYTSELILNLRDIEPGIIAVVGGNGEGKSTLIEAMAPLPLYLELPSYPGKLADNFQPEVRDAHIDVTIEWAGHEWRHLIQVDPGANGGRGKTEAFLYRDGQPVPEHPTPGRLGDYREAIAAIYPPRSVFLAAAFSVQVGTGNWFSLDRMERRDLFARLLGLGQLQDLAGRARDHRKGVENELSDFDREAERLASARVSQQELIDRRPGLVKTSNDAARSLAAVGVIQRQTVVAKAKAQTLHDAARDSYTAATTRHNDLIGRVLSAQRGREDLGTELATARQAVANEEQIRASEKRRRQVLIDQASAGAGVDAAAAKHGSANAAEAALARRLDELQSERERLQGAMDAGAHRRARLAELEPLSQELAGLADEIGGMEIPDRATAQNQEMEARRAQAGRDQIRDRVQTDVERAEHQAGLLERVPCGGGVLLLATAVTVDCSTCELLTDARAAADALPELREKLAAANKAIEDHIGDLSAAAANTNSVTALLEQRAEKLARQRELAYVPAAIDDLTTEIEAEAATQTRLDEARIETATTEDECEAAGETATKTAADLETARRVKAETVAELAGLVTIPEQVAAIDRATARIPELERQEAQWLKQEQDAQADADAVKIPDPNEHQTTATNLEGCATALAAADRDRSTAQAAADSAQQELAKLDGRLDEIGDIDTAGRDLTKRRGALDARCAGWVLLEQALGRDGIQALEIDAAGPEVSELINELLASCFGHRFTCALRTVQEAGAGKKQREIFELEIVDGKRGTVARRADRYSVGERTLISEALKLGLAIFNTRRQKTPIRTLWRDECDGPLEPELAAAYPSMLRRAMELGGYQWVYLISHRPAVWQQADTLIRVADGRAVIEAMT